MPVLNVSLFCLIIALLKYFPNVCLTIQLRILPQLLNCKILPMFSELAFVQLNFPSPWKHECCVPWIRVFVRLFVYECFSVLDSLQRHFFTYIYLWWPPNNRWWNVPTLCMRLYSLTRLFLPHVCACGNPNCSSVGLSDPNVRLCFCLLDIVFVIICYNMSFSCVCIHVSPDCSPVGLWPRMLACACVCSSLPRVYSRWWGVNTAREKWRVLRASQLPLPTSGARLFKLALIMFVERERQDGNFVSVIQCLGIRMLCWTLG